MALIGSLLKKGIKLWKNREQEHVIPYEAQRKELKRLLMAASTTKFGLQYDFLNILRHFKKGDMSFYKSFQNIPIRDYNAMYDQWWKHSLDANTHICWPGKVKYFALSSGTSESSSKHIPITKDMTRSIQRTSVRLLQTLAKYNLPSSFFEGSILMVGGSTNLQKRDNIYEGDLSGIQASRLPHWFQHFYKPGRKIAKNRDWDRKMDEIVKNARKWDIGIIVGVPAWIQILLEKIIAHYQVKHIHEIWPNLLVFVHGGVSMSPYYKGFEQLFGRPVHYIETYLASEGFIAFQTRPNTNTMKLILNNGIFFEFIPFNSDNFDDEGGVKPTAKSYMIDEVSPDKDYAILLSTCAGAWRYLIGDVIRFTSVEDAEMYITGRTKHFLSLCGEHLSVDNMNKAVEHVSNVFNIHIKEYTVIGKPHENLFAHHWYVGTDSPVNGPQLTEELDSYLKAINDDYAVERTYALTKIIVNIVPTATFYGFLEVLGKTGGQNKFPRVLKGERAAHWLSFLSKHT